MLEQRDSGDIAKPWEHRRSGPGSEKASQSNAPFGWRVKFTLRETVVSVTSSVT